MTKVDSGQQERPQEAQPRAEWPVPVHDAVRPWLPPADLVVAVADGRVVVVPPTAAGYVVPHTSIDRYCDALRAADSVAQHEKTIQQMDPPRRP